MENGIFLVGKRMGGHHMLVTKTTLSNELLDSMNRKGWILSQVSQRHANFHYDFVKPLNKHQKIVGW